MVLIWDIYKWRNTGLRIIFRVSPNKIIIGIPQCPGKTYISATASNIGGKQTTINILGGNFYKNWISRLLRKPDKGFVVKEESTHPLPYILEPETEWTGLVL